MKKELFLAILSSALLTTAQGCAHSQLENHLDAKLDKEPATETRAQLATEEKTKVAGDTAVSSEKRAAIEQVIQDARTRTDAMREESLKLRAVLVKDLVSADYDVQEVEMIKSRIRKLEQDRLSEYFGAIRETNRILGRWASREARNSVEMDTAFYNQAIMSPF